MEETIMSRLATDGFEVTTQSFQTSPRRLLASSVLGAGLGWVSLALVPLMVFPVAGWIVATVGVASLSLVGMIAGGLANGALPLSVAMVDARNIIAWRRPNPTLWLVAHTDSKTQSISLKLRVVATIVLAVSLVGLFAVLGFRVFGPVHLGIAFPPLLGLLLASAALSLPALRGGSPGAVDNASGIIAVLRAAELLSDTPEIGVLITGAEEFGMEGARVWVAEHGYPGGFVNFDGIDAVGQFNVMKHATRAADRNKVARLHSTLCQMLGERGFDVRPRALPFGIFVDGAVLAEGGLWGVTVSRGTWETLSVVHTMADTADRTDPTAAAIAGQVAADAVRRMLG